MLGQFESIVQTYVLKSIIWFDHFQGGPDLQLRYFQQMLKYISLKGQTFILGT